MTCNDWGSDQCTGGSCFESSHYSSFVCANAFDDTGLTLWGSNSDDTAWLGYEFASGKNITKISITSHDSEGGDRTPTSFEIRASNSVPSDGSSEGAVLLTVEEAGDLWGNSTTESWEFENGTSYTCYWIYMYDKYGAFGKGSEYMLDEVEMFECLDLVIVFTFSNPIPTHLSTVYGTSRTLQLTTTISGEEPSYIYDAKFYDASDDSQIGSTVFSTDSGQYVFTTMPTLSGGVDYSWYLWATSSGVNGTSSTYTFTNKFKCVGTVKEGETALSGIPVRLYKRDTGELIGSDVSTGISGIFEIVTDYNEDHYCVALYATTVSGVDITETNALIYDHLKPGE